MKRILVFSLAFLFMFVTSTSTSFAAIQNFSRFSCNVPGGVDFPRTR